jgi:hypothetical protein
MCECPLEITRTIESDHDADNVIGKHQKPELYCTRHTAWTTGWNVFTSIFGVASLRTGKHFLCEN